MILLSLDLELNKEGDQTTDIIEIGIVIGDSVTSEILHKQYWFIKIQKPLDPFIIQLTSITQEMLDTQGIDLLTAYKELQALQKQYNCFMNPVQWGHDDAEELVRQVQILDPTQPNIFGRRIIDVKTFYVTNKIAIDQKPQGGLAKGLTSYGLAFKGKKHRAIDDAYNTLVLYFKILELSRKTKY